MSRHKPGTRVRITEDCREGHPATGQFGTYEGDHPRFVDVMRNGEWAGQALYDDYLSGESKFRDGTVVKDLCPVWESGQEQPPNGNFALLNHNPRIRLDDGSVIWGIECWWEPVRDTMKPLEEEQADLEEHKAFLREVATVLAQHTEAQP